jgi:hypothetical protein
MRPYQRNLEHQLGLSLLLLLFAQATELFGAEILGGASDALVLLAIKFFGAGLTAILDVVQELEQATLVASSSAAQGISGIAASILGEGWSGANHSAD